MSALAAPRDRQAFVEAMGGAATGVTVVTTDGAGGRRGQTVSSMCSVSADPPLLLVCIKASSPMVAAIEANAGFAVNVLADHQATVASTFAGRAANGSAPYDFGCASWHPGRTGSPRLDGAVAHFDCGVLSIRREGTHVIFVGSVIAATLGAGVPLVYTRRTYGRPRAL
jgi:flavin reductase